MPAQSQKSLLQARDVALKVTDNTMKYSVALMQLNDVVKLHRALRWCDSCNL